MYSYRKRRRRKKLIMTAAVVVVAGALSYIGYTVFAPKETLDVPDVAKMPEAEEPAATKPEVKETPQKEPEKSDAVALEGDEALAEPAEGEAADEPEADTVKEAEETPTAVDETYFEDALFIGNSRTEGFQIQSGIVNGTFLTHKGLTVDSALEKEVVKWNGQKTTVVSAAERGTFGKIYIMLGVNELGWAYDYLFIEKYGALIDALKEAQPEAVIYVQSVIHVSEKKSNGDKIYNNDNINHYNDLIRKMTEEKEVVYLDLNAVLSDENGHLIDGASFDGVHLRPEYCKIWFNYLKENTVEEAEANERNKTNE